MTTYLLDTEATGLTEPELVEVAWLKLDTPRDLTVLERFTRRYRPSKPIELGALATHHIMDEDLDLCEPSVAFAMPSDLEYLCGHNVDFDHAVIRKPACKRIDTCALARFAFEDGKFGPAPDSYAVGALLYWLERDHAREMLIGAHGATRDAENTLVVLRHLIGALDPATWEDLWLMSERARIPRRWAFGKHKGALIADAPRDYREWALRQADMDPYVLQAVRATL